MNAAKSVGRPNFKNLRGSLGRRFLCVALMALSVAVVATVARRDDAMPGQGSASALMGRPSLGATISESPGSLVTSQVPTPTPSPGPTPKPAGQGGRSQPRLQRPETQVPPRVEITSVKGFRSGKSLSVEISGTCSDLAPGDEIRVLARHVQAAPARYEAVYPVDIEKGTGRWTTVIPVEDEFAGAEVEYVAVVTYLPSEGGDSILADKLKDWNGDAITDPVLARSKAERRLIPSLSDLDGAPATSTPTVRLLGIVEVDAGR
jgi:hypothetical protein